MRKILVGEIVYHNLIINEKARSALNNFEFEILTTNESSYEICALPNDYFVSSNLGSITIFDQNFKQIKTVSLPIPVGCALNHKNELYVADHIKSCIYIMDLDLNIIKTYGSYGTGANQLKNPFSICCQNVYFYVCDGGNHRIQMFNYDFELIDSIQLNYKPYSIKISDTTIGVCGSNGVYFYDIRSLCLKKEYKNVIGRISYINSYFYVISYAPYKRGYCYDHDGTLVEEIKIDKFGEFITHHWDGYFLCVKNNFMILSNSSKQILKYKNSM